MEKDNKEQLFIGAHPLDLNENMDVILSIAQKIEDIIPKEDSENNNRFEKEHPNIIALLGSRGSGKTSILYTLGNLIFDIKGDKIRELDRYDELSKYKDMLNSIYVLKKLIDPSMINGENNILKMIFSLLFSDYIEKSKKEEPNDYQEVISQFIHINESMNYITQGKKEFESLENLLDSQNVFRLREEIYSVVCSFLKSFEEKKTLLVLIDDVDLNSSACYEMLEQLRKYMDLDNIIIVLSGSLDDFMSVLMNEYSKQLHYYIRMSFNEETEGHNFNKIQQMAENYLTKIVPEPYRINVDLIAQKTKIVYTNKILDLLSCYSIDLNFFKKYYKFLETLFGKSLRERVQYYYLLNEIKKAAEKNAEVKKQQTDFIKLLSEHISVSENYRNIINDFSLEDFDGIYFVMDLNKGNYSTLSLEKEKIYNWIFIILNIFLKIKDENKEEFLKIISIPEFSILSSIDDFINIYNENKGVLPFCNSVGFQNILFDLCQKDRSQPLFLWDLLSWKDIKNNLFIIFYITSLIALCKRERGSKKYIRSMITAIKSIKTDDYILYDIIELLLSQMEKEFREFAVELIEIKPTRLQVISHVRGYVSLIRQGNKYYSYNVVKRNLAKKLSWPVSRVSQYFEELSTPDTIDFVKKFKKVDFKDEKLKEKYINCLCDILLQFLRYYRNEK